MIRADMISTVGRAYLTSNIENDEYSYPRAFSALSKILCKSKTKQAKGRLARASIIWDFLLLQYSRRVKRYARRRRECRFTLREKY